MLEDQSHVRLEKLKKLEYIDNIFTEIDYSVYTDEIES